jgi:hypothetical protein
LKAAALIGLPLLILGETSLNGAGAGDEQDPTTIVEIVMYGVDEDTDELLRYSFRNDEYIVIGEIRDQENGNVLHEVESLGFIPSGPHKGLYGVDNYDGADNSKLIRFDVFDATVAVYPVDIGFGNIEGMVSSRDPETGEWTLYATQTGMVHGNGGGGGGGENPNKVFICHRPPGNPDNAHTIWVGAPAAAAHLQQHAGDGTHPGDTLGSCDGDETISIKNLIQIDPATGLGEMVMQLDKKFEGLAQGPDGVFYAANDNELWAIDLYYGTVGEIGANGHEEIEALEYAYGDYDPQVEVPGIPASWTASGVLLGFSDADDAVLILNPATGEAVEYQCAIDATDIEGMVFMTEMNDPYGWIVALPCD